MELEKLDAKNVSVHGKLDEQIYMEQPLGFIESYKEHMVCLLKKSLYGLKQYPRCWYKCFDDYVTRAGFIRGDYDLCVYMRNIGSYEIVYLLLYVDDISMESKSKEEVLRLNKLIRAKFEMNELGPAKRMLGIEINRDRKGKRLWVT